MTEHACETCGNAYHRAFQVVLDGKSHTFDCFECAIHALAPVCAACGCRVIGHGVETRGVIYCCASCAVRHSGDQDPVAMRGSLGREGSAMTNLLMDRAMFDPAATFGSPTNVLQEDRLSRKEKVAVLERWKNDEHAMIVAEEENMRGNRPGLLREVLCALDELGERPASTNP